MKYIRNHVTKRRMIGYIQREKTCVDFLLCVLLCVWVFFSFFLSLSLFSFHRRRYRLLCHLGRFLPSQRGGVMLGLFACVLITPFMLSLCWFPFSLHLPLWICHCVCVCLRAVAFFRSQNTLMIWFLHQFAY